MGPGDREVGVRLRHDTVSRVALTALVAAVVALCWAAAARANAAAAAGVSCGTVPAAGRPNPIVCDPISSSSSSGMASRRPLVLALYGTGGSPALMESLTSLNQVAGEHGFVVAYPGSSDPVHPWAPWSDVTYLGSLIDQLIATQNVDPNRVYVTGFSAGAGEAWRVACHLSTKVAAVAAVADALGVKAWGCSPARPVSQLLMIGTQDGQRWTGIPGQLLTPLGTTQRWQQIDGCTSQQPNQVQHPVPTVTQDDWTSCTDGTAVSLYIIGGARHVWPLGGPGTPPGYSASEAIWAFFAPLRATPLTLSSTDGHLSSVSISRSKRYPVLVAKFRLAERLTITEQVRGTRRVVTRRTTFQLQPGTNVSTKLNLPAKLKAGRYTVTFTLRDQYGRSSATSARVRLR